MSIESIVYKPTRHLDVTSFIKTARAYCIAAILSILVSLILLQITSVKALYVPFNYFGDTIFYAMTIKSVITTGWYLQDPSIGAPNGHYLADFPTPEGLNYLLIKLLSLFSSNWVVVLNLFFLLGFPLITLSSLFVFRQLGLHYPLGLTASLLFTFLPYRLIREESHLFLSSYYMLPLAIWLALLLYQNKLFPNEKTKTRSLLLYCLIALLLGSNGVYHAYFSSFFILLGGVIARRTFRYALLFITLITLSLLGNIAPTLLQQTREGINSEVIIRDPLETEQAALTLTQLLLPRDGDRLFATLKDSYNHHALSITENTSASLGLIGALGFLYLIGYIILKRKSSARTLFDGLADFNLSAVLLATLGGFSSLISFFFLPEIRAYNRICVFIAFFALAAFFLLLQKQLKRPLLQWACSLSLVSLGLYNQSSPRDAPKNKYPQIRKEFTIDHTFVQRIEQILPPGSLVFQLPYIYFPEGPRNQINSYAHFKPALHSPTLKWSFGAMKGRSVDLWQRETSSLAISQMIPVLLQHGFTGLYIDKFGYPDSAKEIMSSLKQILKTPPLFDQHGRSFWDLRSEEINHDHPVNLSQ